MFAAHHLEALALGHSPGRHTLEEVREAISCLVKDAHLVEARLRNSDRSFVTDRALKAERAVIAMMKAGFREGMALAAGKAVAAHLADAGLTEGQEEAVRTILLTPDRVPSACRAEPGPARRRCCAMCANLRASGLSWASRLPPPRRGCWGARRAWRPRPCNGSSPAAGRWRPDRAAVP